jgi:hypothetical protein
VDLEKGFFKHGRWMKIRILENGLIIKEYRNRMMDFADNIYSHYRLQL